MTTSSDPALDTLFIPFKTGMLPWPSAHVLFLRARLGNSMLDPSFKNIICEQTFKPDAEPLIAAGFNVVNSTDAETYPLIMVLLPRQREEARALLAQAVRLTQPGGQVVACLSNSEGARSGESDMEKLVGPVSTLSKHKCRVFWSAPLTTQVNKALLDEWSALDAPRPICDGRFISRPGLFAWNRIDRASQLLATHLPANLSGHAADLGAGFGYLSVEALRRCANITAIDLYEAEARALTLATVNLREYNEHRTLGFHWHDVTQGIPPRYDVIITNPPFHTQSRADRPDIGKRFITVAAAALRPEGQLWLVANRHLPYEDILTSSFSHIRTVAQEDGFKIIAATKTGGSGPSQTAPRRIHR